MVLTLCALCAFSQNLRINFYAQIDENKKVAPDSVLVENLASGYNKMIHKELSDDKSITIIGKWLDKPNTIEDEPAEQDFLCQKTKATIAVSMNRSAKLHLALYNISGTKITDYVNDFGVGQYEFSVSAPIGIYVLTANDGVRSSSLKLSIEGYDNARIEEIAVENANNSILKSYHDTVKFYNIEDLRFTGYYNGLSDVQFFDIASFLLSEEIVFTIIPLPENLSIRGEATDITSFTATLSAVIKNPQGNTIIEKGFFIGENNPVENGTKYVIDNRIFTYTLFNLAEQTTYMYCPYVVTDEGTIYGDVLSFTTEKSPIKDGAILAAFSVSETKQIYFSQGNLQYQASTRIWRFAENQWDYVGTHSSKEEDYNGGTVEGSDNAKISATYHGWIDLFGWATSGYNDSKPYNTLSWMENVNLYGEGEDITGTNYDWGVYNKISNGGNKAGLWRTLTSEEFLYLKRQRTDASKKNGSATVNGVKGAILLPDNWVLPDGLRFFSEADSEYGIENNYSLLDWAKMELAGAVFLPFAGERNGIGVDASMYYGGEYWLAESIDENRAYCFYIENLYVTSTNKSSGLAVRLVKDVK